MFTSRQSAAILLGLLVQFLAVTSQAQTTVDSRKIDWSTRVVESTMKQYPGPKELGGWSYAKSLFLYGQYLVYRRTHDPRYLHYIKDWVDSHVDAQGVVTTTNAQGVVSEVKFDNLDSMLPGNLLLILYQETGDQRYKIAADRIRKRFDSYPRTGDRGFWHATGKSREWQLWGDGVFMSMPFLIRYGKLFGDSKYADDEASSQLIIYGSHLNDPKTGLMFHAYDESGQSVWADRETKHSAEIWCRAMGWFGMTLVETLDLLPRNHPSRPKLLAQLRRLVAAWAKYQDPKSGLWFQVTNKPDDPNNWVETSSSSMFVYVIRQALANGYIPKAYRRIEQTGYSGLLTKISLDENGDTRLVDICEGTNVGDLSYYLARKRLVNDFHGLGAFLIMNESFANPSFNNVKRSMWQPGH
ncbi:MAG TPA: glycoside hydrolase family 88 protein [Pyrinomonadaceae bacterium]|nr:glycoside hydrolase family 88 protein [Pyrinomonadaceae bacterium]